MHIFMHNTRTNISDMAPCLSIKEYFFILPHDTVLILILMTMLSEIPFADRLHLGWMVGIVHGREP